MADLIDLFLHLDAHLREFVMAYGPLVYGLLFLIVFAETGLVVTPFLPGDSLLFAVGALSATGVMNLWVSVALLLVAAVLGDAVNYAVGHYIGPRVFTAHDSSNWMHRALNRDHLDKAHAFFEKYGGKAVVLGRFVPIVRTFVPFVAGAGAMTYGTFAFYNVTGAVAWVGICVGAGYLFGDIPIVQKNFSLVALGIIFVSLIPMALELLKARRASAAS
ncbi:MAG: DedA family protein [Acidobacteria bacterium]|nr:DedA family protein [Acidobacteriota bacterium]